MTNMTHDARPADAEGLVLESWSQGFMQGALIILIAITVSNMRNKVLLHKLILVELVFGIFQGFSPFFTPPVYGWYIGIAGVFLNISWSMHNVIAWMKNKPFLSKRMSMIYIGTVIAAQPYWVVEATACILFFNDYSNLFTYTRPWEALFRDPWWLFTSVSLFYNIKRRYEFTLLELVRISPRFGVMLGAMTLSIIFIICDILAATKVITNGSPEGINPFWKLAFAMKCLTDTIILDDFKTALDKLKDANFGKMTGLPMHTTAINRTYTEHSSSTEQLQGRPRDNSKDCVNGIKMEQTVEVIESVETPKNTDEIQRDPYQYPV